MKGFNWKWKDFNWKWKDLIENERKFIENEKKQVARVPGLIHTKGAMVEEQWWESSGVDAQVDVNVDVDVYADG